MAKILLLEDTKESFELAKQAIGFVHDLSWAKTIKEAKFFVENSERFDLLIVDVELPDGDGFEFCGWIRSHSDCNDIPLLFVSARNSVESCVTGFLSGGDDYISKPFHSAEFKARVESKLRLNNVRNEKKFSYEKNGVVIDLRSRRAYVDNDGIKTDLQLTPTEFKILQLLLEEPGMPCERDEILNRVWGEGVHVFPRSVDTHVSKLRKKLGSRSHLICSVHGSGYRFGPQVFSANAYPNRGNVSLESTSG